MGGWRRASVMLALGALAGALPLGAAHPQGRTPAPPAPPSPPPIPGPPSVPSTPRPPTPPEAPSAPRVPTPPPPSPAPAARPGRPAPDEVVTALQAALAGGIHRFEARDLPGVLGHVSEQYWTGPFTKATVRAQLVTLFQIYQAFRVRVRIDEVRLVGEHAWVYSTGEVTGLLPLVGQWMTVFSWQRELEVTRREQGVWRLYGYQQ